MSYKNMQVLLAQRPEGWVKESDFRIVENELPAAGEGELVVQNLYLSLDPYMRGRMNDSKSYAEKTELGHVMVGGTVGTVVESNNAHFQVGDTVVGYFGWQQYAISKGNGLQKITRQDIAPSAYLSAVGMPGITAWVGLLDIGRPQAGETVVVSAASGAVGSVVGQLAKLHGCRAVGIAGGKEKCDYVVQELGFDACIDYKAGRLVEDLQAATPDGVDIYFENVGGVVAEAVMRRLNAHARIPLCGLVSQYNEPKPQSLINPGFLLINRLKIQGFIVSEHLQLWPQAIQELEPMVASGKIKYRESIVHGLENAPRAFIGMLKGENFGKQLVELA